MDHNSTLIADPCLSFGASVFPFLPFSFLSSLSVSPPILPSCSSYFSLLPGARRSVPDGNSLRLQEPPWRPHGGGTGGEQSGPVLPRYPSLSFSSMYFFLPFHLFFFLSSSLTLVSSLSPLYPACQATQVLRVTCSWLRSLNTEPSPPSPTASPQLLLLLPCSYPLPHLHSLLSPPSLSNFLPGGRR